MARRDDLRTGKRQDLRVVRNELTWTLECPCCGDDGAYADPNGQFADGQPLVCGCDGHVTVDEDDGPRVWVRDECDCRSNA
jgi:hypothetical protein